MLREILFVKKDSLKYFVKCLGFFKIKNRCHFQVRPLSLNGIIVFEVRFINLLSSGGMHLNLLYFISTIYSIHCGSKGQVVQENLLKNKKVADFYILSQL